MLYRSASTKVVTGIVTYVNARIWEPQIINGTPIYTASVLIPKSDQKTNEGVKIAVNTALRMGVSLHRGKFVQAAKRNLPIHDGDSEDMNELFRGHWVVNAGSLTAPSVLDYRVYPIKDRTLVCPGCKVRVSLSFFPYSGKAADGRSGVGCMLGNIQKAYQRSDYEVLPDIDFDRFAENFTRIVFNNEKRVK